MRIIKKRSSNTKILAYTLLVLPTIEYGAACWDPYRKGQINALDRVQNIADKFACHRKDSNWGTLTKRRKIARVCALLKRTRDRGLGRLYDVIDYKDHAV
jgi:hypothetical protein